MYIHIYIYIYIIELLEPVELEKAALLSWGGKENHVLIEQIDDLVTN